MKKSIHKNKKFGQSVLEWTLKRSFILDKIIDKANKVAQAKAQNNYPAIGKILKAVKIGCQNSQQGYDFEAAAFGELALTSQSRALRYLFFSTTALKKEYKILEPKNKVSQVGVLGGRLMGEALLM